MSPAVRVRLGLGLGLGYEKETGDEEEGSGKRVASRLNNLKDGSGGGAARYESSATNGTDLLS